MGRLAPHATDHAAGPQNAEGLGRCTRPLHRCDTVGKLIVYYRELKGWTQKQLWGVVGMSQSRLSSLERDTRKPSFDEVDRIAFFLEQPLNRFSPLRRTPPQEPPAGSEPVLTRI